MIAHLLLALVLANVPSPEFAKHRAEARLTKPPAKPDVSAGRARRYRTRLREEAAEGVNFNGHYRVAMWGCGTNCVEWAVIDLATGRVWMAPEPLLSCAYIQPEGGTVPDWMELHPDSSLLYVHRCDRDEYRTFDTRLVYVWKDGRPRLLRTERLKD